MEKKYFPNQCLDKAFLEPGESNANVNVNMDAKTDKGKGRENKNVRGDRREKKDEVGDERNDKKLIFFEEKQEEEEEKDSRGLVKEATEDLTERKVEEFFKYLKKNPNKDVEVGNAEPFLSSRSSGLPPRWESPHGTVVLVNKPKGKLTCNFVLKLHMKLLVFHLSMNTDMCPNCMTGWTSFTVCGKLRRLVKVKKVFLPWSISL